LGEQSFSILVVDDEIINLENVRHYLIKLGYSVQVAANGHIAIELIEKHHFDLVVTDLKMEGIDGTQVMAYSKELLPNAEVIIMTGYATVNSAVEAMAQGAYYYLPKPIKLNELKALISKALEKTMLHREISQLKQQILAKKGVTQFIGHNKKILKLKDDIALFAQLDCNVMIIGETGTGKELVARTIHELSPRADKRFMPINCAALSEDLVLNELFGHEKDAYTGASKAQRGLFETADGGVVLLDEIGEMPTAIQAKMLRVFQDKKLYRVGGTREIQVDIRVLAATNRDLEKEVERGTFRQDLFFRLNVATLTIPPLRQRKDDIPLLVHHFLVKYPGANNQVKIISPEALQVLMQYDYPGNVRELENIIERAMAICDGPAIERHHLPQGLEQQIGSGTLRSSETEDSKTLKSLEEHERDYIIHILKSVGGNKTKAAKLMGIDRVSLWRKLNKYKENGIDIDRLFKD
jgi:DNA-binding NtrC family response regulator